MMPSDTRLLRMYYRDDWRPEKIHTKFKTFGDVANMIFTNTEIKKIGILDGPTNVITIFCGDLDQEVLGQIKDRTGFTMDLHHFKYDWSHGNAQTFS